MEVQKCRIGLVVLLAAGLVAAAALVGEAKGLKQNCYPGPVIPTYDERVVTSKDNTAIVAFSGFIEWFSLPSNETNKYSPIDAQELHLDSDSDYEYVSLVSTCNVLKMSLRKVHHTVHLEKIEVSQTDTRGRESKFLCKIKPVNPTVVSEANSYSCNALQVWNCDTYDDSHHGKLLTEVDPIIFVNAYSFKFELNGNPDKIKWKQFSKPAVHC